MSAITFGFSPQNRFRCEHQACSELATLMARTRNADGTVTAQFACSNHVAWLKEHANPRMSAATRFVHLDTPGEYNAPGEPETRIGEDPADVLGPNPVSPVDTLGPNPVSPVDTLGPNPVSPVDTLGPNPVSPASSSQE